MDDKNVKISQGLLLIRTKSGTTKLEKVLVHAQLGKRKNQVKWLQKYVKQRRKPTKIPVFVKNYRRGFRSKRILRSLPSSVAHIKKGNRNCDNSGEDVKTKKYQNLNEEEKKNLLAIINLDKCDQLERVHNKYLQGQNEDSGMMSMSQTNASDKASLSSELNQSLDPQTDKESNKNKKARSSSRSDFCEEIPSSSTKAFQVDFIENTSKSHTSKQPSSKKESCFFTDTSRKSSTSVIFPEDTNSSPNKLTSSEETPKPFMYKNKIIFTENQKHSAQFPVSYDDNEEHRFYSHPQRQRTSIVMTQYESTSHNPPISEKNTEDNASDDSYEDTQLYIDSGLRPLKSDESKLYLRADSHQQKKHHTTSDDDDIEPLLEDIPSDIFEGWDKQKKKKKPKRVVKQPSTPSHKGDFTSSEDKSVTSQPSNQIDTEPLKKLQEFEDVKFTIETEKLEEEEEVVKKEIEEEKKEQKREGEKREKEKKDFCVHINDVPDGDFSSSTVVDSKTTMTIKENKEKYDNHVPVKEDFCVHTTEPPGKDSFSTDSFGLSSASSIEQTKNKKYAISTSSIKVSKFLQTSKLSDAESVKSASSSYSALSIGAHFREHSVLIPSTKERRESKSKRNLVWD